MVLVGDISVSEDGGLNEGRAFGVRLEGFLRDVASCCLQEHQKADCREHLVKDYTFMSVYSSLSCFPSDTYVDIP